ncbi:chaperonin-like RbcX protein 2, chloroplastic isoform X2 [Phragmites australis]|uniref:chaperonin-like RbcX protein 2, chloroplastic isoform X2 n=1 Tax=Phragmites australis TaxID=29695 RepID=UPI002D79F4EE|nr:chaperonin-like RbcX protein 2, chloroplastic isoform X2 [Phragmites australis]
MAGVQMMLAAVNVGAEGSMAGLRKRPVVASSGLSTSMFAGDWRRRPRRPSCSVRVLRQCRSSRSRGGLGIVCNLGGQYEDSFEDVQLQLMNYFTYKAVRTVLTQLYEMNPPSYRWFYNFVAVNKPTDGKLFLRALGKERQELAERVMITRLHLYGKWIKKCDHAKMYEKISNENLTLMRERLMETVIFPTDDTNTEKIG